VRVGLLGHWIILIVLGTAWGTTVPLTKTVVSTGHSPIGLIFWQLLFVSLILLIPMVVLRIPIVLDRTHAFFFLVISLTGTLLPNSFSYFAAFHLPAGIMGIVIALVPMFALMIALGIGTEKFSVSRLSGVFMGITAVALLIGPETSLPEPEKAIYILVALIAPFCYGCETNFLTTRSPPDANPVSTLFVASVFGTLIAAPLALASGSWVNLLEPWGPPEWSLLASSMLHTVAYCGYIWLVSSAGAVFSSQIAYVVTIASVFLSGYFLGEIYSGWVWLALAIMVAGIALVRPTGKPVSASVD